MKSKMAKPKIGDVFEIITQQGLRYGQYTHNNKSHGYLVRILRGVFDRRPDDLGDLVQQETQFVTLFPLAAAAKQGFVKIVGSAPVPQSSREFPLFRAAGYRDPVTGSVSSWWLWDGEKEWMVGELSEDQWKLPLRGIWNYPYLVEKLESNWSPIGNSI